MTELSENLLGLAEKALRHAADSVLPGDDLIPFVLKVTTSGTSLERYMGNGRLEVGVEEARQSLSGDPSLGVALAYDGYFTDDDGKRWETLFVEAQERGDETATVFAIRTQRSGLLRRKRETVGNPMILGQEAPALL